MAIAQTGSTLRFVGMGLADSGTVSSAITVPADATKAIVVVSAFDDQNFPFDAMTFTKGGVDSPMTRGAGTDYDQTAWQGAMFYIDNPDTGSNKTLKWDWLGAGTLVEHPTWSIQFWNGAATGIRDGDGHHAVPLPWTTPTLTAQNGDKIVVAVAAFCTVAGTAGTPTASGWTVGDAVNPDTGANGGINWGTADPTGDQTVGVTAETGYDDGGIMAIVLTPSGVSDPTTDPMTKRLLFTGFRGA